MNMTTGRVLPCLISCPSPLLVIISLWPPAAEYLSPPTSRTPPMPPESPKAFSHLPKCKRQETTLSEDDDEDALPLSFPRRPEVKPAKAPRPCKGGHNGQARQSGFKHQEYKCELCPNLYVSSKGNLVRSTRITYVISLPFATKMCHLFSFVGSGAAHEFPVCSMCSRHRLVHPCSPHAVAAWIPDPTAAPTALAKPIYPCRQERTIELRRHALQVTSSDMLATGA